MYQKTPGNKTIFLPQTAISRDFCNMVSEVRGPEDAFEPLGDRKIFKSITFYKETYRILEPSRISGLACQIHFVAVDAIHAIDA